MVRVWGSYNKSNLLQGGVLPHLQLELPIPQNFNNPLGSWHLARHILHGNFLGEVLPLYS